MFWFINLLKGNVYFSLGSLFFLYAWLLFILRLIFSLLYKSYKDEYEADVSVIIPVYNENFRLFERCLKSAHNQNPKEIIVIVNGGGEKEPKYIEIAKKYNAEVFTLPEPSKRKALSVGIRNSKYDIVVLLDSDTIMLKNSLKELLKPFKNPKVGGATPIQTIINSNVSIVRKFAGWMEDLRFALNQRAQSSLGAVGCLPGRAIALRKKLLLPYLDDFINEKFLGIACLSGDDRYLTSIILKQGYKTVLQDTSLVYTNSPDTFIGFLSQQLRWARSSQRETILSLNWLYKYPYTFFCFITDMITPFFLLCVEINIILHYIQAGTKWLSLSKFIIDVFIGLLLMNLSLGVKQLPHLKKYPADITFLPLYTLFITFIMVPLRIYGFFTMWKQEWVTREVIWSDGSTKKDETEII